MKVGDLVSNPTDFTNPIGVWFRAGTVFKVTHVGMCNALAQSQTCGTLTWIKLDTVWQFAGFAKLSEN